MKQRKREIVLKAKIILFVLLFGAVLGSVIVTSITSRRAERRVAELETANERLQAMNSLLRDSMAPLLGSDATNEATDSGESIDDGEIPDIPWNLRLINEQHPLDPDFVPELVEIAPSHFVDARIADAARQMLQAAEAAGMSMFIVSAYRSYDTQKEVFNETMQGWLDRGKSLFDAFQETSRAVAIPGTSEHAAGLALDIISSSYGELDEQQATTPETQWLMANSWRYGFILRYPSEKSHITGIVFEPWHYRYVGIEAARVIFEQGITLEEYLGMTEKGRVQ